MTVLNDTRREFFDGGLTTYDFEIKYFNANEVSVYIGDDVVNPADYTLTANPTGDGGTIVLDSAAAAGTRNVLISAELDYTQEVPIPTVDRLGRGVLETVADKNTMLSQQLKDIADRSFKFAVTVDNEGIDLDVPTPIAGRALKWNDDATGLENTSFDPDTLEDSADEAVAAAATASAAATTASDSATAAGVSATAASASAAAAAGVQAWFKGTGTPAVAPIAGGTAALAAGTGANAAAANTIAMGDSVTATDQYDAAVGSEAAATGGLAAAFGRLAKAIGQGCLALGYNAQCKTNSNTTNTSSVAIGPNSLAYNVGSVAVGNAAVAGQENAAAGAQSVSIGQQSNALHNGAIALGYLAHATTTRAKALGRAEATKYGQFARGVDVLAAAGDMQISEYTYYGQTTDNATHELFLDATSAQLTLAVNQTIQLTIYVLGKVTAGVAVGTVGSWKIEGTASKGANNASTVEIGTQTLTAFNTPASWGTPLFNISTGTGAIGMVVQGKTSTTIQWYVHVVARELTY